MLVRQTVDSPLGKLYLAASDQGLEELFFAKVDGIELEITYELRQPMELGVQYDFLDQAEQELSEYFAGERKSFSVPVAPQGTDFQRAVWAELQKIPFGVTISYIELARRMGDEKKTRAVALANGKNPISIIIPCHRVIGANGHLVGYGGGIENKRWLIDFEATDRLF